VNEYAARVATLLVSAFPENAQDISVDVRGELCLRIECPSDAVSADLSITTDDEQVTVAFHTYHVHSRDWSRDGSDGHITDAILFAQRLIDEHWVVLGLYWDGRLGVTRCCSPEEAESQLRELTRRASTRVARLLRPPLTTATRLVPLVGRIRRPNGGSVRSWRGTYDADFNVGLSAAGWE